MSLDNCMMMDIYPYGGVLAYLKYHYLDGIVKQNLLSVDKTRYVYDAKKRLPVLTESSGDVSELVGRFGVGGSRFGASASLSDRASTSLSDRASASGFGFAQPPLSGRTSADPEKSGMDRVREMIGD